MFLKKFDITKRKNRLVAYSFLATIPLPAVVSFVFKYLNLKEQAKMIGHYEKINSIPQSAQDMQIFIQDMMIGKIDEGLANKYQENLISAKQNNELSDSLLQKYNCSSTEEFENYLTELYQSAKLGDETANQTFQNAIIDYDNDVYVQAYNATIADLNQDYSLNYLEPNFYTTYMDNIEELLPYTAGIVVLASVAFLGANKICKKANEKMFKIRDKQREECGRSQI